MQPSDGRAAVGQIHHPGPPAGGPATGVAGSPGHFPFTLEPGDNVEEAITKGVAAAGCAGGFVSIQGGRCEPFRYVMPAPSPDADHAAWYSDTFAPTGPVDVRLAGAIVGVRDGRPFIHCHGTWDTQEGPRMGHLLGPQTIVAEPITVTGIGVREATFKGIPDPETNFTLFEPMPVPGQVAVPAGGRALLARVRPNQDISLAIEE